MNKGKTIVSILGAALIAGGLIGCGSSNDMEKEDPAAAKARVEAATQERELATKSGGNFESLSAEDKATAAKLFGSEAAAKSGLARMGGGGGTAPAGGGLPPSGPNGLPPSGPPTGG